MKEHALIVLLTEEQENRIVDKLTERLRGTAQQVAHEVAAEMQNPMRDFPLVGTAGYWGQQKGKNNGKTYSAATFRKWANDNGVTPIRQSGASFYRREDAARWIYDG